MLGGLARWLRMLGYVTEYDSKADDNGLLQSSRTPDAFLLTRDEELYNRALAKSIHSVLVLGGTEEARLGQLAKELGIRLEIDMAGTRCPECGAELHDRFWRCNNSGCGKTYWVGSHWKQIRHTLEEARKITSLEEKDMKC